MTAASLTAAAPAPLALMPLHRRMVELISVGATNREIGRELGLTLPATTNQVHRLLAALGARNRAHAVRIAIEAGLLLTVVVR